MIHKMSPVLTILTHLPNTASWAKILALTFPKEWSFELNLNWYFDQRWNKAPEWSSHFTFLTWQLLKGFYQITRKSFLYGHIHSSKSFVFLVFFLFFILKYHSIYGMKQTLPTSYSYSQHEVPDSVLSLKSTIVVHYRSNTTSNKKY